MEKNNKKISLTEIIVFIVVLVSVVLILIDMTINVKHEIDLESQTNAADNLPIATQYVDPIPYWMSLLV
jgi:flagellar basal body-associated protein FliL